MFTLQKDALGDEIQRRIYLLVKSNRGSWQSVGVLFGLGGGMLSIVLGGLLWVAVGFIAPEGSFRSFLNALEIAFFVLSLPLLAFGVHCLDLLEEKSSVSSPLRSERQSHARRGHPRIRRSGVPRHRAVGRSEVKKR